MSLILALCLSIVQHTEERTKATPWDFLYCGW
jgi:hypothetical protein